MSNRTRALATRVSIATAAVALAWSGAVAAQGFDVRAGERQERWRSARAGALKLPLPGTPDTERPLTRLFQAGLSLGAPVVIRVFKAESEFEVWMKKGPIFVLFATYPVCFWSGTLGPKLREGDRQTPEGFYTVTEDLLHFGGRWRRALNIGYPNAFDRASGRTGSAILVHGGCDSSGCFAMTHAVNAELYDLVASALRVGQAHVPVHVFPFRMTDAAMARLPKGAWNAFWGDLKLGYDSFLRTRLPPHVSVCGRRYLVHDAMRGGRDAGEIALCDADREAVPPHLVSEPKRAVEAGARNGQRASAAPAPQCSVRRASCRRWVALRDRAASPRHVAGGGKVSRVH